MFHQSQAAIHKIIAKSKSGNPEEKRLVKNVVSSLAASLQELSGNFRKSQSTYLKSAFVYPIIRFYCWFERLLFFWLKFRDEKS